MINIDIKHIQKEAEKEITEAGDLKELNEVFRKYLGRNGRLSKVFSDIAVLSKKQRTELGKEANEAKEFLEKKFGEKNRALLESAQIKKTQEAVDITAPGRKISKGHLHPLTLTRRKIEDIFQAMGFSIVEGPEIETEYYNFDALNIPPDHPARDVWDTLWLKTAQKLLLRTHTSPVQIRYMEKNKPPFRIIVPGRVFRHEATDVSHDIQFYQVEGLMVGKDVTAANFRAIIQEFFLRFFSKPVSMRLRPSFFPFTEPSFEVDIKCFSCAGKGCSVCSRNGWIEIIGAGMVHPNVLKAGGLNPKDWQGFAFGVGMDRLAMMKYKIQDIRLFYGGDLRFLKQF